MRFGAGENAGRESKGEFESQTGTMEFFHAIVSARVLNT